MSLLTNWLESLSYELEISEACSKKKSPLSTCTACIEECPQVALTIEDGTLKLDKKACSLCGLCITVCPQQAIEGQSPSREVIQDQLLLQDDSPLPSFMELLYFHKKGVRFIQKVAAEEELDKRVGKVNEVLNVMELDPLLITKTISIKEETQPKLSRRGFFTKLSMDGKRTVLSSVTPVKWRFNEDRFNSSNLYKEWSFHEVTIHEETCTLCEACFNICHAGVFTLENDILTIDDQHCSGCNLCLDICQQFGIQIVHNIHKGREAAYHVKKNECLTCRSSFYSWEESNECDICKKMDKPNFFL
ncbi:4Fe-4S binding protein [Mesobacillus subterraneus]|uniref:4Fe-4S binding protein n=1 Tax=Mesobacillus subterraneus TaxID=285983 RepID=UPI001CFDC103|nr:4Fe-4S dicluster domain-containing protein [Mesobacillus subterraneus]WLR57585.1 4Fe-4S binding protein [Mesobacillus subterraneus]